MAPIDVGAIPFVGGSMNDPTNPLSSIGQIAIPVKDLDRAIAFYRDALGLRFLFRAPPALAFFDCGGLRLLLDIPEDEEFRHNSSVLYFRVTDIQDAYRRLNQQGVKFRGEPHIIAKLPTMTVWMAFFSDNEGNTHALMAEVPSQA